MVSLGKTYCKCDNINMIKYGGLKKWFNYGELSINEHVPLLCLIAGRCMMNMYATEKDFTIKNEDTIFRVPASYSHKII